MLDTGADGAVVSDMTDGSAVRQLLVGSCGVAGEVEVGEEDRLATTWTELSSTRDGSCPLPTPSQPQLHSATSPTRSHPPSATPLIPPPSFPSNWSSSPPHVPPPTLLRLGPLLLQRHQLRRLDRNVRSLILPWLPLQLRRSLLVSLHRFHSLARPG